MYNITYFGNFARYIRKKVKKIKQTTQTFDLVKKKKNAAGFWCPAARDWSGRSSEFAVISEEDYLFGFVFELVEKLRDSG